MIAVLDYGIGNLRSAQKALQRFHPDTRLVASPTAAAGAVGVVLPGVGAFGRCIEAVRATGLDAVVHDAVERDVPFLGVCVGMQMLYEGSDEDPGVDGLGILPGRVRRLPDGVKRPQMQWNRLDIVRPGCPLLEGIGNGAWVYFVHSYAPEPSDDVIATCEYGTRIVALAGRRRLWATQFHPEKSSSVGLRLMANFVAQCEAA